jgi:spore coat protein JB
MEQKALMKKLQELGFMLVELNLYLDNHPDCRDARLLYNKYSAEMAATREEYFEKYGPTMNFGVCPAGDSFSWVNSPWPWEN